MSKQLDDIAEVINKYLKLQEAASMVLEDFRLRREQTQAEWDKQEETLRSHVLFYQNVIANYQQQYQALNDAESQQMLKQIEEETAAVQVFFNTANEKFQELAERHATTTKRGAVTEAVENMLQYAEGSVKVAKLTDRLVNTNVRPDREDASAAVRSALKNLKKQGKIRSVGPGEYVHVEPKKPTTLKALAASGL